MSCDARTVRRERNGCQHNPHPGGTRPGIADEIEALTALPDSRTLVHHYSVHAPVRGSA